ncbi:death domain-associated protein 6-like [Colias croceus]|uniref:death domain-associated protein 6-like n=1 Tax=Colias crocea TaxID=72248 RepID=UPI001E27BD34|nr:death domain-associated protein 6-like [Colias croceus]
MNCDIVDLSQESPDDDCEILVDNNCSLAFLNINLESEDIVPEIADIIKQCLKIENTTGMVRVIKRSLMRVYYEACPNYIKSIQFKNVVKNTSCLIEQEPHMKFFHIKCLCETLKLNKKKKRVNLIPLGPCTKRKSQSVNNNVKKKKIEIIDLDDIEDEEIPKEKEVTLTEEKETECLDNKIEIEIFIPPNEGMHVSWMDQQRVPEYQNNHFFEVPIENDDENIRNEDPKLLVVQRTEQVDPEQVKQSKIKMLESEIAELKGLIDQLDEEVVDNNSIFSPYVQSEAYKKRVVKLYQELCELTDSQPVKRHEIHITVSKGFSEGPARILENLLNNNLKSNGYPPFPTFMEVRKCVEIANNKYNLGWKPVKKFQEASALFAQCGRALQKLRQQREWGHLLSRVKRENCEDPADTDEALRARLDANKEIAKRRENEIFDRYASLENELAAGNITTQSVQNVNGTSQNSSVAMEPSDESDSDSDIVWDDDIDGEMFQPIPIKKEIIDNKQDSAIVKEESKVNNEDITNLLHELGDDFTTKIIDIEDPFLVVEISDSSDDEVL